VVLCVIDVSSLLTSVWCAVVLPSYVDRRMLLQFLTANFAVSISCPFSVNGGGEALSAEYVYWMF
jgi:hypothetical protein